MVVERGDNMRIFKRKKYIENNTSKRVDTLPTIDSQYWSILTTPTHISNSNLENINICYEFDIIDNYGNKEILHLVNMRNLEDKVTLNCKLDALKTELECKLALYTETVKYYENLCYGIKNDDSFQKKATFMTRNEYNAKIEVLKYVLGILKDN